MKAHIYYLLYFYFCLVLKKRATSILRSLQLEQLRKLSAKVTTKSSGSHSRVIPVIPESFQSHSRVIPVIQSFQSSQSYQIRCLKINSFVEIFIFGILRQKILFFRCECVKVYYGNKFYTFMSQNWRHLWASRRWLGWSSVYCTRPRTPTLSTRCTY